jgi:hypothetical protein
MSSSNDYRIYPILITAADPQTGTLTLSDDGKTVFSNSLAQFDFVYWIVPDTTANIEAITGINVESGPQIFSAGPLESDSPGEGNKSVWVAQYFANAEPAGTVEEYTISWVDTDGNEHVYDPKLTINL